MARYANNLYTHFADDQLKKTYDDITGFLVENSDKIGDSNGYTRQTVNAGDAIYQGFPTGDLISSRCGVKPGKDEKEPCIRWATQNRESAKAITDALIYHFDYPSAAREKEDRHTGEKWEEIRVGRKTALHMVDVIDRYHAALSFYDKMNRQLDEFAKSKRLTTHPEFIPYLPRKNSFFATAAFPTKDAAKAWQKMMVKEFDLKPHYREGEEKDTHFLVLGYKDIAQYLPGKDNLFILPK